MRTICEICREEKVSGDGGVKGRGRGLGAYWFIGFGLLAK